jgi:flagellar protein FlgJ
MDAKVGAAGLQTGRTQFDAEPAGLKTGRSEELEKLKALAAQFEAVLMGQMLKEMRSSMFEDDDASGFGGGPLADSMYAELSQVLGRAGGFGLSQAMQEALSRQASETPQLKVSGEGPITGVQGLDSLTRQARSQTNEN